jgi:hypothetical protein
MVRILQCQTFPINPHGAEPALSVEQVWEVLKIKSRSPQRFIPAINSSNVLEENEAGLTRKVEFKQGMGPGGPVVEDITFFEPWKVSIVAAILSFPNENNAQPRLNVSRLISKLVGPMPPSSATSFPKEKMKRIYTSRSIFSGYTRTSKRDPKKRRKL